MKIRELRKAAGLTQAELAKKVNVDQSAISHWERGVYPPLKKYRKAISKALHCKESDLMEISESGEKTA